MTTIRRDRAAEFNATQTIRNLARWDAKTIGEAKVWEALHRIGVRDGAELVAIAERCGTPEGAIEKALTEGRRAIEWTIDRHLTVAEREAYELGFNGAVYH